jgi:hypothetical protein
LKRVWIFGFVPLLVAAGAPEFRFHRPIEAPKGWTELEVPADVLEAARPGLADVRIRSERGDDVPYVERTGVSAIEHKLGLVDVESAPNRETTAIVDRGDRPGWADAVELGVTEAEFIKPVTLEASADRKGWSEIAKSSIFATSAGASVKRIRFAPSDRRYLRLRFDDRNSPPIHATEAALHQSAERRDVRLVPVPFKSDPDADVSVSTYAVELASANLPVVEARIDASDGAFSRRVRVFERVLFRDEVTRRLLGQGEIVRSADGRESTAVSITEPTSRHLEIDVERSGGVPLHVTSMSIAVEPRTLLFYVPDGAGLELLYGSSTAARPSYDLGSALATGRPKAVGTGKLGTPTDTGKTAPTIGPPPRGGSLDLAAWRAKAPIALPARGPVAYLDLDRGDGALSDVRIVDQDARQVPYVVEAKPRRQETTLGWSATSADHQTVVRLTGLDPARTIEALEIDVAAPDYFSREVTVVEPTSDPRGPTGERVLGSGRLIKAAESSREAQHVSIGQPSRSDIAIRIADGDNAPLTLSGVRAVVLRRRVNFVFAPGDRLTLAADNPAASAPQYDLALVAERVLASPAEPATLGAVVRTPEAKKAAPPWFWLFISGAAVILFLAVARALRQEPTPPSGTT